MKFEYIDPFVSSTIRVLDLTVHADVSQGNLSLVKSERLDGSVAIVIKVRDENEGSIIVNMDTATALRIAGVLTGENNDSLTPYSLDSLCELANVIAGNASSKLNDLGYDFKIEPPRVLEKEKISGETLDLEIFQVPLITDYGEITVNVAMRTN